MDIALMLEGQIGLNWSRWQRIAVAAEELGFVGLYRSDHFTNPAGPDLDSLEMWTSLTWLASHTKRLEFGPMVAPLSFRHPVWMARMGLAVDDLSGGRLHLGLGAGWQVREHEMFGFDLLEVPQRMQRFREGVEVVHRLLWSDEPVTYEGEYYQLRAATLLPRPQRKGGPSIVIGGGRGTLPLVARYANEWNTPFATAEKFAALSARLDELLERQGRPLTDVRRSLMTGLVFGRTEQEVQQKLTASGKTLADVQGSALLFGTASQIVDQLGRLAEAGVQRVMLQWIDLDDLDGLTALAQSVLPQIHQS
jgi:F420-dependent oxidoreductase-like protein